MTDTQPPPPSARSNPKKARLPILLTLVVCLSALVAWVLVSDTAQRKILELQSTSKLEQTTREAPKSPWPYYLLGLRYARARRLREAADLFEQARQREPDSYEILFALGKADIYLNAPQTALPLLEQASKLHPNDGALYTYLATAQRLTGNTAEGIISAKRATDFAPDSAEAWYQYGMFYTASNHNESEGLPYLKKAASLSPGDGVYNFAYASSLTDGSQFAEAIPYLRKATTQLPQNSYAHFLLAVCLHRNGNTGNMDEAITELKRSIALTPNDFRGHFELGNVLEEEGQFAAALPEFETASRLNPYLPDIWYHVNRMADRTGKPDLSKLAKSRFEELRALHQEFQALGRHLLEHPEDTPARIRAGQVMEKQGNFAGAALQYQEVLSREPENKQARALSDALHSRVALPVAAPGVQGGSTAP